MKKKKGHISVYLAVGISVFGLISLIASAVLSLQKAGLQSQKIGNVVKHATLAAAIYDTNLYGTDHSIVITDDIKSYNAFIKSLKESMYLDGSMNSLDKGYTKGKVKVNKFIIYNVKGNDVEVITKGDIGESKILYRDQKGVMRTPTNVIVDKTMIYSRIDFTVNIMGEDIQDSYKDATIGVVNN